MTTTGAPDTQPESRYEALAPRARRRLLARSLLRAAAAATVLVALYYGLPMDDRSGVGLVLGLTLGLLVFVVVLAAQVWQIVRSDHPRLRAVEALAAAVPLFLLVFATTYFLLGRGRVASFSEPLTRTDALYYAVTVFATVGFGDITPDTTPARVVTMLQMLGDLVVFGMGARLLVDAVTVRRRRRGDDGSGRQLPT